MVNYKVFAETPSSIPKPNSIEIKKLPLIGLGVFAKKRFFIGDIIEQCAFVLIQRQLSGPFKKIAINYDEYNMALILGCGSVYNHSPQPNAKYTIDHQNHTVTFTAISTIEPEDEIVVSFAPDWFAKPEYAGANFFRNRSVSARTVRALTITAILVFFSVYFPPTRFSPSSPKSPVTSIQSVTKMI